LFCLSYLEQKRENEERVEIREMISIKTDQTIEQTFEFGSNS